MIQVWRSLRSYISEVRQIAPAVMLGAASAMLVASLLEGIGLMMLVPLLALLGVGSAAGEAPSAANERITDTLSWLSLEPSLELVLGGFLGIIIARALVNYLQAVLSAKVIQSVLHQIRSQTYEAISAASWLHVARRQSSSFAHAITTQADSVAGGVEYLLWLGTSATSIVIGLSVALLISAKLTLVVVGLGLALAIPVLLFDYRAYRLGQQNWSAMSKIFGQITKHLFGLKAAKILSAEKQFETDFAAMSNAHSTITARAMTNNALAGLVHTVSAAVVLVGFVYVVISAPGASSIEPIVLIVIFSRILPRALQLQSYLRALFTILADFEALNRIKLEASAVREDPPVEAMSIELNRALRLEDVSFSYAPDTDDGTLKHLSVTLPARQAIGLIGPSGAGKTTFADILAGLIAPSQGCVFVDDVVMDKSTRAPWRRHVSYVLQDEYLFNDTVRANLRAAAPVADDDQIWQALDLARASEMVKAMKDGLSTGLGDRGVRLSRGQRQRLCLARALLKQPELLILDEATSALNPVDEKELISVLQGLKGQLTIVMIAHRPSSVAWTDQLLVLNEGLLIEHGTLRELMTHDGGFTQAMIAADTDWSRKSS